MNRRLLLALGAFVIWTALTVIGGRLRTGGEAELVEGMIHGVNWVFPVAAAFLLAVVARLQADAAFQTAMRKRMHPGMVMVVTDNPLHPDRRSGTDFVIMTDA